MPGAPSPSGAGSTDDDFTRLHITPFDADLSRIVLPASVLPKAKNVSFHTVETFPENRYGYVDLPTADAEKLKSKLNGSVLKGVKMRIETAHPESRIDPSEVEERRKKKKKDKAKKSEDETGSSKKRKRDDNTEEGILLSDRKVKRGWTETPDYKQKKKDKKKEKADKSGKEKSKDKAMRIKSKYSEQEECLLKVRLPAGASKNIPGDDEAARKKRKKKGKEREVIVHEFENTTRFPTFLRGTDSAGESSKPAAEFIEGKGWVGEDGTVVEPVTKKSRPSSSKKSNSKVVAPAEESDGTSSSGTSSEEEEEEDDEDEDLGKPAKKDDSPLKEKSAHVAESETSSDASEDEDAAATIPAIQVTPSPGPKAGAARPTSSGSSGGLRIKIPPPNTPTTKEVHPLEALYKRNKPNGAAAAAATPAQNQEPFTFFGGDEEDQEEGEGSSRAAIPPMPMTPFTRQDIEWRNVRSAAPTPDTAHPSRMQSLWSSQQDEEDDEDVDDFPGLGDDDEDNEEANNDDEGNAEKGNQKGSSDFQAWFWENRRELNQSWMKRKKSAAKEKRHRENKARASKAV